MKSKKSFFGLVENVHRAASLKFNPSELCKYLKRDGDVCIVDKELAFKDGCNPSLFAVALNSIYDWDYKNDFETVTAYLETDGFDVYGGVYDLVARVKLTKCLLASTIEREEKRNLGDLKTFFAPYIYTGEKLAEIISKLAITS